MTTKPRAPRFRVRPAAGLAAASRRENRRAEQPDDGFGSRIFPTASAAEVQTPQDAAAEEEIAAIKAEGLTGRQLRMARRVALRHRIDATSDFDAVRLLRKRGIDPFRPQNMLELIAAEAGAGAQQEPRTEDLRLPQTVPARQSRPAAPAVFDDAHRAAEIRRVQQDIARRRRRRLALMFLRLFAFVLLPTILTGFYFYRVATPMYATTTEFVIQQAQPQSSTGGMGGLFSGTAMATVQDSITVQSYLQSREAMLRLERDHGFRTHFSDPSIDPLQRLEPDATNEAAYKVYKRNVTIGYDPTEGIVKMEVVAPDPELSATFSKALISYAEEQVDQLTQRLREDQMSGARANYEEAEAKVLAAQQRVIDLQEQRGIISADAEVSLLMTQISTFETELQKERIALQQYLENTNPNATRVSVAERNIARLENLIADLRAQMTQSNASTDSLARITGELMIAESELETRQMLLAQALQQMEDARIEANRQVRYLSTGVSPVAPDEATYPRAFENTAVAFLIFAGVYLMLSITVAVLREQVSA